MILYLYYAQEAKNFSKKNSFASIILFEAHHKYLYVSKKIKNLLLYI